MELSKITKGQLIVLGTPNANTDPSTLQVYKIMEDGIGWYNNGHHMTCDGKAPDGEPTGIVIQNTTYVSQGWTRDSTWDLGLLTDYQGYRTIESYLFEFHRLQDREVAVAREYQESGTQIVRRLADLGFHASVEGNEVRMHRQSATDLLTEFEALRAKVYVG